MYPRITIGNGLFAVSPFLTAKPGSLTAKALPCRELPLKYYSRQSFAGKEVFAVTRS
jgi:hypothetical protein